MPDRNLPPSSKTHQEQEVSQEKVQQAGKLAQNQAEVLRKEPARARKIRSSTQRKSTTNKSRVTIKLPVINEEHEPEQKVEQGKDQESTIAEQSVQVQEERQEQEQQIELGVEPEAERQADEQEQAPLSQKRRAAKSSKTGKREHFAKKSARLTIASILFFFLGGSAFLFAHDLTANYVYAYALNPNNGAILEQQNLESLSTDAWLSTPLIQKGEIEIGIQRTESAQKYQLQRLKIGEGNLSQIDSLIVAQSRPTLSFTSTGDLISSGGQSLQVRQSNGRLLWQQKGQIPTKGAHRFQVVSDEKAIYSIVSAATGEVVAYDRQNGKELWTQQIGESLAYTPPFMLDQGSLYIASEHEISALNSSDGTIRWQVPVVARTLLLESNGGGHVLLTAGAGGLLALKTDTGETLWQQAGQSTDKLTATQFYQATLAQDASKGEILYASGIRWHLPEIEEQAWLYAVDASTGKQLWSQQIGAGLLSGDSSRVFTPLSDQSGQGVIIQHQESASEQHVSAYDSKGNLRWDTIIHGTHQTAPSLLQVPGRTIYLFAVANDGITALATLPANRYLILLAALLSLCGLIFLWHSSLGQQKIWWEEVFSKVRQTVQLRLTYRWEKRSYWKRSYIIIVGLLCLLLIGIIISSAQFLRENRPGIYQINAASGNLQWQQSEQDTILAGIDGTGSISIQEKQAHHWLQASNPNGAHWQTFTSEGKFALATTAGRSDSLLVALTGNRNQGYQFAENDPGYPDALASLFILASFARQSGQLNWQTMLIPPQGQQQARIVGADQRYVYISSIPDEGKNGRSSKTQLMAVNQHTGNIDWRIFGPGLDNGQTDTTRSEKLFLQKNQLLWQIQGRIYRLDANSGQIEWQRTIPGEMKTNQQAAQLAITSTGYIIVATQESISSIEENTGMLLWTQQTTKSRGEIQLIEGFGDTMLLIRDSMIEAYQVKTLQSLWTQKLSGKLQSIVSTNNGKQLFFSLQPSIQSKTVIIQGIETRQGRVNWHYSIPEQTSQAKLLAAINGEILISVCEGRGQQNCGRKRLYMLAMSGGTERWKTESKGIRTIAINPEGSSIAFQID